MAQNTKIEWTTSTWNPVTGCSSVSPGCDNCYARRMAKRLKAMGNPRYKNGFEVTLHHDLLQLPLTWKKPQMVFVNSMSDLFHEKVPFGFIESVFETMRRADRHVFQVLTKRAERLRELAERLDWPDNVWMGVTVECQSCVYRIPLLLETPAAVKFISAEPLIESLDIDVRGLDWVIAGGESGPSARAVREEWLLELRDRCGEAEVPFFFKQWGGVRKKRNGRLLDGQTWDEFPPIRRSEQMTLVA